MLNFEIGLPRNALCDLIERIIAFTGSRTSKMVGFYKQSYTKVFLVNMSNFEIGLTRYALCNLKEGLKLSQAQGFPSW